MPKRFTRTIEDFICANCGREIIGNGYTNHCPFCLWSKHVDHQPGDRANSCQGLMEPVSVITKNGQQIIEHHCLVCGQIKNNKVVENDNFEVLLSISSDNVI